MQLTLWPQLNLLWWISDDEREIQSNLTEQHVQQARWDMFNTCLKWMVSLKGSFCVYLCIEGTFLNCTFVGISEHQVRFLSLLFHQKWQEPMEGRAMNMLPILNEKQIQFQLFNFDTEWVASGDAASDGVLWVFQDGRRHQGTRRHKGDEENPSEEWTFRTPRHTCRKTLKSQGREGSKENRQWQQVSMFFSALLNTRYMWKAQLSDAVKLDFIVAFSSKGQSPCYFVVAKEIGFRKIYQARLHE